MAGNQENKPAAAEQPATPPKKKPSWLHTILWMIGMMLLVNVAMAVVAYFLFFYGK